MVLDVPVCVKQLEIDGFTVIAGPNVEAVFPQVLSECCVVMDRSGSLHVATTWDDRDGITRLASLVPIELTLLQGKYPCPSEARSTCQAAE